MDVWWPEGCEALLETDPYVLKSILLSVCVSVRVHSAEQKLHQAFQQEGVSHRELVPQGVEELRGEHGKVR